MSDTSASLSAPAADPLPAPAPPAPAATAVAAVAGWGRWIAAGGAVLAALAAAALVMALNTQQRVKTLEGELVRRQQDSGAQSAEARLLAGQAHESARDSAAKIALIEGRLAEVALQRTQLEELLQSMARSRDENVLADVEAAIRVALQQSAITGSAEPLTAVLRQADERLARYNQPRLERVRRAVLQDLERARAAGVADIPLLTIRLDDVVRLVDDLPLLSAADRRGSARVAAPLPPVASAASSASAWTETLGDRWRLWTDQLWREARALVRVTRIDVPEAMLVAPEQAFFLRENLKLRLLNARLALLSRQFDIAQSDLRDAQSALERYFDRSSRRVVSAQDQVRLVAAQARTVSLPRPDATLAAIAAAAAGR